MPSVIYIIVYIRKTKILTERQTGRQTCFIDIITFFYFLLISDNNIIITQIILLCFMGLKSESIIIVGVSFNF